MNMRSGFGSSATLSGLQERFADRADFKTECFTAEGCAFSLIYLNGAVELTMLQSQIYGVLRPDTAWEPGETLRERLTRPQELFQTPYEIVESTKAAERAVLSGQVVLLLEEEGGAWSFPFNKETKRSVTQPGNEKSLRGPQDSFIEDIDVNLSLVRGRIRSTKLKVLSYVLGEHTQTRVLLLYMEGICSEQLLQGVKSALEEKVKLGSVLGSSYVEECLESTYSLFPQMLYTERPDVAAAALLEGRLALFVDGSPNPVIAPASFFMFLQAADDYYQRYTFSTWIRLLRVLFLIVSLLLPSTYVAITTFHPEMIPANLLITVAASRDVVPFPAIVEAFTMELTFEVLREAGQRIPKAIGQTVSIAGALVIGQAAVQAGIVSAPMVIIVALTGISSFITPHYEFASAFRLLRFLLLILAAVFGLIGVMLGLFLIYIHLLSLGSYGVPYLKPIVGGTLSDYRDIIVRMPWPLSRNRKSGGSGS